MPKSILIQFDGEDFADFIREVIADALRQFSQNQPIQASMPQSEDKMLTRQDIRKMFHVSLTTVDIWVKKKYITSVKLGGRRYFRHAEVAKMCVKGEPKSKSFSLEDC